MTVCVGDATYVLEDGELIWGDVVSLEEEFIFIKWADLENVVKHHRAAFSDSDFVKPVLSIEDAVKELLG